MDYGTKIGISIVGMIIMAIGFVIYFISHGIWYGFYPTEVAAERGYMGEIIMVIGLPIFLFGLLFPRHIETPDDNSSRTPLGSKNGEENYSLK